jgi:RNA polymerase sigma factor (sigma-70 family)
MGDRDDHQLLDDFVKARSQGAFRELVERHLPVVYSAARRLVRDAHLAEEVAQSVFTTLAQKAGSIRPPQVLGGWLYNTTRHLAMHAVRTEQRRRERETTAFAMQSLNQIPDAPVLTDHLEPALAELDAGDRDALVLRFLANRGLREVGAELGVSEDAARKRVSRALERLRLVLENRGVTATAVLLATALTASTLAVPAGLGATIASTALAPIAAAAVAKASLLTMKPLGAKVAVAVIILACAGGAGRLVVQNWNSAGADSVAAAATPAPTQAAADKPVQAAPTAITGILKAPNGRPLAGAEVFLSTVSDKVPVYSERSGQVVSAVTASDGRFSFPSDAANRAVIAIHDTGYGQATVAELATQPELALQSWARVEGVLREGTVPQAKQTIHLSRTRFGSKSQEQAYRTVHDTTTKTDANGHYVFPRVAPGDAWISWRKNGYDVQYRYFDIEPGQSLVADIGGRGRSVIGRAVLMDSDAQEKFYGSVWPKTLHQMRRPPNWSQLSSGEQDALTAGWEQTPDAKIYNQERCPIDFRIATDGTFTVPDLPTGAYRVVVASWTGAPVKSRMVSRGQGEVVIRDLPGGRSDELLDMGEVKVYFTAPLAPGDRAPLFETTTLEGRPVKLADFSGKHVLLNFWRTDVPESVEEMSSLKAAQSAWGKDKRFVLLGLNADPDAATVRKFVTDHGLTWTQCTIGKGTDLPMRYRLRRPTSVLIGPDGLILQPDLHGPTITDALQDVLGVK